MLDLLSPSREVSELALGLMLVAALALPIMMWWSERR
jgi:hypothetical protein